MQMVVKPDGALRCLCGEEIDLHAIGKLSIERGSHVEPTNDGHSMGHSPGGTFVAVSNEAGAKLRILRAIEKGDRISITPTKIEGACH